MKNFFKSLLLATSILFVSSCDSDDEDNNKTSVTIVLKDSNGNRVPNMVVYAYDESTWSVIGDDPFFASFQSASNTDGEAKFDNVYSETNFTTINNYQNTFRFSAHYSINGVSKKKLVPITLKKGENRTETMILN